MFITTALVLLGALGCSLAQSSFRMWNATDCCTNASRRIDGGFGNGDSHQMDQRLARRLQSFRLFPEFPLLQCKLVRDVVFVNVGNVSNRLLPNVFSRDQLHIAEPYIWIE